MHSPHNRADGLLALLRLSSIAMDCRPEMAHGVVPSTVGIWSCCQDSHDEDAVREFFGSCGTITNVRFMTDRETWAFKGCCWIEFEHTDATDAAVALNGAEFKGRNIKVDYQAPRDSSFSPGGKGEGKGKGKGKGDGKGKGKGKGKGDGKGKGKGKGKGAPASAKGSIQDFAGAKKSFDDDSD
jgi:RNA recognition motif-containing protein